MQKIISVWANNASLQMLKNKMPEFKYLLKFIFVLICWISQSFTIYSNSRDSSSMEPYSIYMSLGVFSMQFLTLQPFDKATALSTLIHASERTGINYKHVWLCDSLFVDGNAIWFIIRCLKISLSYLCSFCSESQKNVDHIRQDAGFVLKNARHHLAWTQSSLL